MADAGAQKRKRVRPGAAIRKAQKEIWTKASPTTTRIHSEAPDGKWRTCFVPFYHTPAALYVAEGRGYMIAYRQTSSIQDTHPPAGARKIFSVLLPPPFSL